MGALFHNFAVAHHQNQVRVAHGGQAVGNHQRRAPLGHGIQRRLNLGLGNGIHRSGGFVQNENSGIRQHRPGKGDQLLFTRRQQIAALAHVGIQSVFQMGDDLVGRHGLHRRPDFFLRGVGLSHQQIFPNGAGEQMGGLQHIADGRMQPQLRTFPGVPPVDEQLARGGLVEPADQIDQRGFARAGFAHDGDMAAEGNLQGEMLQHVLVAVGIAEGHVLEFDVAPDRLPVFLLGLQNVAVLGDDLGGIDDVGLHRQQVGKAFDVDLGSDQVGNRVDNPAHRLHHALGIGHEGREGTHFGFGDVAALPQHDGQGNGRGEVHGGGKHAPEPGSADAAPAHIGGFRHEALGHFVLDGQGFNGLCAGNALVEVAGNPGIDFTHFPVHANELFLEKGEQHHQHRQNQQHQSRQAGVQGNHHRRGTHQIGNVPHAVHQRPGGQRADAGGIAHDPGVDVAHAVLVKVGKGQGLQMPEGGFPQIPVDADLRNGGQGAGNVIGDSREDHRDGVENDEEENGVHGLVAHIMIQRVTPKKRQDNIHQTAHEAAGHHQYQVPPKLFQKGQDLADAEKGQSLFVLLLVHASIASSVLVWVS